MKIFSKHRKKIESRRRFGGLEFRSKIKDAGNYKRAFNPTGNFSLSFISKGGTKLKMVKAGGVLTVLALGYLLLSNSFSITEIVVHGNRQVETQRIEEVLHSWGNSRFLIPKNNNFFVMSQGRVQAMLAKNLPLVKEVVRFERIWPNKLVIEIVERNPGFVIESGGNYFLVDDEGVVVTEVENSDKYFVAANQLTENFVRGEILQNQKLAPFILSMNRSWSTKVDTPLAFAKFPGKSNPDVEFVTEQGWSVLFDTNRPVTVQLSNLAAILSRQISPQDHSRLAYIDLRLSKWVYYCFKESACQQQEQPDSAVGGTQVEEEPTNVE